MSVKIQPYYIIYCRSNTSHSAQYTASSSVRVKILYYYVVLLLKSRAAVGKVDPTCVRVRVGGRAGRGSRVDALLYRTGFCVYNNTFTRHNTAARTTYVTVSSRADNKFRSPPEPRRMVARRQMRRLRGGSWTGKKIPGDPHATAGATRLLYETLCA